MNKRMIDLSTGGSLPQVTTALQPVRQSNPPVVRQLQSPLLHNVANPSYTTRDVMPFENIMRVQEISAQIPANVRLPPPSMPQQVSHPSRSATPQEEKKVDDPVIINGCDVTGCESIEEIYEKNKRRIRIQLS